MIYRNSFTPVVTKEHGSWAVLFVPLMTGAISAGSSSWNIVLFGLSSLGIFMSYVPVQSLLRAYSGSLQDGEKVQQSLFWTGIYAGIGVLFIVPLLMQGLWMVLLFGVSGLAAFAGNFILTTARGKSIAGDLVAVAGLTMTAPCAYYVQTRTTGSDALVLWILNFLFFGCSVFSVHMKMRATGMKKTSWQWNEKFAVGFMNMLYHLGVIGIVSIMVVNDAAPAAVIVAFLPMMVHAVYGTVRIHRKVHFKRLGFLLLAESLFFFFVLVLSVNPS